MLKRIARKTLIVTIFSFGYIAFLQVARSWLGITIEGDLWNSSIYCSLWGLWGYIIGIVFCQRKD